MKHHLRHNHLPYVWGTKSAETELVLPCDRYRSNSRSNSDDVYLRAIEVYTSVHILFRWLCQLKVASYSYGLIDRMEQLFFQIPEPPTGQVNPQQLLPGIDDLAVGQRMMGIFRLVEFEVDRHLTMVMDFPTTQAIVGDVVASYVILPEAENTCRLIVKGHICYPKHLMGAGIRWIMPWIDLVMMQKQLTTLKQLAERDQQRQSGNEL